MALSVKVGSFAGAGSTGNQAITGIGFQPKLVKFFYNDLTADTGAGTHSMYGFGAAVSSSSRFATSTGNAALGTRQNNTKCCELLNENGSGTIIFACDFVSMDADGFTVNITTALSGVVINFIAYGGTDLTNVAIKQFTTPTATGNQATSGVGFLPDYVEFYSVGDNGAPPSTTNINGHRFGHGRMTSAAQACFSNEWIGSNHDSYQRTDKCFAVISATALFLEATYVSLDSDGFTINFGTVQATAKYVWAICMKGGQYKTGAFTKKTSTGSQGRTGIGFQTVGLEQISFGETAQTTLTPGAEDGKFAFGAGSSSSQRGTIAFTIKNPYSVVTMLDRTKLLKMYEDATLLSSHDLTSLDSDGWTENYATADGTARQYLYTAFGSAAGGTTFTASLSGSVAGSGALMKQANKALAGSSTGVGALAKQANKALAGSSTGVGVMAKFAAKAVAGSSTAAGALAKQAQKPFAGSSTATGAVARLVGKALAGSAPASGAIARAAAKALTGTMTSSGAIAKLVSKPIAGSVTPSGGLGLIKVILRNFGGSVTAAGALTKAVSKSVAGSVSPGGALAKSCAKAISGTVTAAGTLVKQGQKALSGSGTPAGALTRLVGKGLSGSITSTGSVAKLVSKAVAGSVTSAGTLSKGISKALNSVLTAVGSLVAALTGQPEELPTYVLLASYTPDIVLSASYIPNIELEASN